MPTHQHRSRLVRATPDTVRQQARQDIDHLGRNGCFIRSSGCTLSPTIPDDDVIALVEEARIYGHEA